MLLRKRNHRIQFRLNDEENAKFQNAVEQSGLSKEVYVRKCVLGKPLRTISNLDYADLVMTVSNIMNTYIKDLEKLKPTDKRVVLGNLMVEKTWEALKELR